MSNYANDDLRIKQIRELLTPDALLKRYPATDTTVQTVATTRAKISNILTRQSNRLVVVIGPCSIHDPQAAREYADKLSPLRQKYNQHLEIVMRTYFEKPRTTVGWKGLINDPDMDNSFQINTGLQLARQLLLDINNLSLPTSGEFLDMISPQYLADLMSWGAIGARTTESQLHRELVSGLSCPIGFKNATDGSIKVAIDAIGAAANEHCFLSVTKQGRSAIVTTTGNQDCHIILRGGKEPNYQANYVQHAAEQMAKAGFVANIMIDFSHGNSLKQHKNQLKVSNAVCQQISQGNRSIMGVMVESNLVEGNQDIKTKPLVYGKSITDACVGWDDTEKILEQLATAVAQRDTVLHNQSSDSLNLA